MSSLPAALVALSAEDAQLGLATGQVQVVDYNPAWPALARGVSDLIRATLTDYSPIVEHIGSTSVPGLAAKPLLDFAVGIDVVFAIEDIVALLEQSGFTYQLDLGNYGGQLFSVESPDSGTTLGHVHVVSQADFQWTWYSTFRDGLIANDNLRQEYENLKRSAAREFATDRQGYTKAKFDWVLRTVTSLAMDSERATS